MSHRAIVAFAFCGLPAIGGLGCASTYQCQACYPPAVAAGGTEIATKPFDGAAYSFSPPGANSAYYQPAPSVPDYPYRRPYVANYYGPFPRAAAQDRLTPFYQPGPYYYTRTAPYVSSYYSYYSSPEYLRY